MSLLILIDSGLRDLDTLKATGYLLLTPEALLRAAALWATVRQAGLPMADRFALDADVILAAQAIAFDPADWEKPDASVVIATSNVGHLARFTDARLWTDIS